MVRRNSVLVTCGSERVNPLEWQLNQILVTKVRRKWSPTWVTLKCWTNSPSQYHWKCRKNMENMLHGECFLQKEYILWLRVVWRALELQRFLKNLPFIFNAATGLGESRFTGGLVQSVRPLADLLLIRLLKAWYFSAGDETHVQKY